MKKREKCSKTISMAGFCLMLTAMCNFGVAQASIVVAGATYSVDTTSDDAGLNACTAAAGDCSLRGAIDRANFARTNDTINFDSSLMDQTIVLTNGELYIENSNIYGSLTINGLGATHLTISGNNTSRIFNIPEGAVVTIDALKMINGAANFGGAITNYRGTLTLSNSILSSNSAVYDGGALNSYEATQTLTNLTLNGNSAGGDGGGLKSFFGTNTLTDSTVSGNTAAQDGGGILIGYGIITLTNSTVSNNAAGTYGSGGGLYINNGATATLTDVTISGNTAYSGGGVINSGATLTATNSTLSGNTGVYGGGFYSSGGATSTLTKTTISGNSGDIGGGVGNSSATVTLSNSTISNNTSPTNGGGGIYNFDGTPTIALDNTIVAGNKAAYTNYADILGPTTSNGYNLIGISDYTTGWVASDKLGLRATPLDAKLLPLANNGGLTKTHALGFNSPALDAANSSLTTDQRGLTRPYDLPTIANASGGNGSDIGAFEAQSLPIQTGPTITIGDASVVEGQSGSTTLVFPVTLSTSSTQSVSVNYATQNGTAIAGNNAPFDYTARSGTLTFLPGQTTRYISVIVRGDLYVESNDTLSVVLSNPTGDSTFSRATATGTIQNDDGNIAPALTVADVLITEGNSGTKTMLFTFTLDKPSETAISVNYATQNGTAISGNTSPADYSARNGVVTFAPNQTSRTVAVTIYGDTSIETSETFKLNLSNASGATMAQSFATGTINNDD